MDRHIRKTKEAEHVIRTRSELVSLLRFDQQIVDRIISAPATFYSSFSIPKANGELREIRPPNRSLRVLQRLLLREFLKRVEFRSCLHGGIRGRSAVSHARVHVGRRMVATLDVKKFFPSTTVSHVAPVIYALGFLGQAADDVITLLTLNDQVPKEARRVHCLRIWRSQRVIAGLLNCAVLAGFATHAMSMTLQFPVIRTLRS